MAVSGHWMPIVGNKMQLNGNHRFWGDCGRHEAINRLWKTTNEPKHGKREQEQSNCHGCTFQSRTTLARSFGGFSESMPPLCLRIGRRPVPAQGMLPQPCSGSFTWLLTVKSHGRGCSCVMWPCSQFQFLLTLRMGTW